MRRTGETSIFGILFVLVAGVIGGIAIYHYYGDDVAPKVEQVADQAEAAKKAWQKEGR